MKVTPNGVILGFLHSAVEQRSARLLQIMKARTPTGRPQKSALSKGGRTLASPILEKSSKFSVGKALGKGLPKGCPSPTSAFIVRKSAMVFDARVLQIMIASPSDTMEERDAIERAIHGWNASRAVREQVVLLPRRWELHAVPLLGSTGQAVINEQLVDNSDILVAIFDSRLGSATASAVSGTSEEIQRASDSGKPVHVWFSNEPLPREVDADQLTALREFKRELSEKGLLGEYANAEDLQYQVRAAIESDLDRLSLGAPTSVVSRAPSVDLRAEYAQDREPKVDARGRSKMVTKRQRIIVTNAGTEEAAAVSIALVSSDSALVPPHMLREPGRVNIQPDTAISWPILTFAGSASVFDVVMEWTESGEVKSKTQTISQL